MELIKWNGCRNCVELFVCSLVELLPNQNRRQLPKKDQQKTSATQAEVTFQHWWWARSESAALGSCRYSSSNGVLKSTPPATSSESFATYWARGWRSTLAQSNSYFSRTYCPYFPPIRQSPPPKACFFAFGSIFLICINGRKHMLLSQNLFNTKFMVKNHVWDLGIYPIKKGNE